VHALKHNSQTEKAAKAFKALRNLEEHYSQDLSLTDHGKATKNLQAAVKALHNSDDLFNLVEVQDVLDELHILTKLFNDQISVIKKMIESYNKVDELTGERNKHRRAVRWLGTAQAKVDGYIKKCEYLNKECTRTRDMVRQSHPYSRLA
jgi:hypothetical protein